MRRANLKLFREIMPRGLSLLTSNRRGIRSKYMKSCIRSVREEVIDAVSCSSIATPGSHYYGCVYKSSCTSIHRPTRSDSLIVGAARNA